MSEKKREKIKIEELETKKKKKSKSKKLKSKDKERSDKNSKKEKTIDKPTEDAPKRKRGRPFGASTKQKAVIKLEDIKELEGEAKRIHELLEDFDDEDVIQATQKYLYQTTIKMLPVAEERYYLSTNHQSIYAYNTLVSQARELIADIQAAQDNSKVMDTILYDILEPTILSLANFLMDANYQLVKQIKNSGIVKEKNNKELQDIVNANSKVLAGYAQEMFKTLKERLPTALE